MIRSPSGERVVRALLERRGAVLAFFALALALAVAGVARSIHEHGRVPRDNSLEIWFLEDDPALVRYREFLAEWGNDEAIVVAVFDEEGVLRAETLEVISLLSERISALKRVERVTSLSTVHSVRNAGADTVEVDRYFTLPLAPDRVSAVADTIREDPLYGDFLVSPDGKATVLSVQLETSRDFDQQRKAILGSVRGVLRETLRERGRDPEGWAWGGIGVIHVALNSLVMSDSAKFMVLTNLLVMIGLALAFRRALAVVACLLSVAGATILLIGAYLGTGFSLNMVTMVLPTLVMVVGLTDSVYFLTTFQLLRAREPDLKIREAVVQSLGFCFWPGLFNSITTSVGFLAFLVAPMEVVRHLGVFAGFGVACAFFASLTVCALLIERFPNRIERPREDGQSVKEGIVGSGLARLAGFAIARRKVLLGLTFVAAGLAGYGISRLVVDSYSLAYFHEDHEIRRHDDALLSSIGPYLPLELVVRTPQPGGAKRADVLRGIESLIAEVVAEEPTVRRATSLPAVVKRLTRVFSDDPQAEIPTDPAAIDQLLDFYDPRRAEDPIWLVDEAWQETRFQFQIKNEGAGAGRDLLARIHARAPKHLPPDVELISGGYMPLYAKLVQHLVWSQVTSIAITTGVVFCLIALLFRSLRYALISFLPNVLPVAMTLALMGYLGIRLDMATVMVAAIALGVAVDDTIHFLYKFRAALAECGDPEQAVRETITSTGRAIFSTSLIVTLGFSALAFASIKTVSLFGLLLCATMLSALVAEFLVTPALILAFPPAPLPAPEAPAVEA